MDETLFIQRRDDSRYAPNRLIGVCVHGTAFIVDTIHFSKLITLRLEFNFGVTLWKH